MRGFVFIAVVVCNLTKYLNSDYIGRSDSLMGVFQKGYYIVFVLVLIAPKPSDAFLGSEILLWYYILVLKYQIHNKFSYS